MSTVKVAVSNLATYAGFLDYSDSFCPTRAKHSKFGKRNRNNFLTSLYWLPLTAHLRICLFMKLLRGHIITTSTSLGHLTKDTLLSNIHHAHLYSEILTARGGCLAEQIPQTLSLMPQNSSLAITQQFIW